MSNCSEKRAVLLLWLILFLGVTGGLAQAGTIRVYFSPHRGCTDAIVRELSQAKSGW